MDYVKRFLSLLLFPLRYSLRLELKVKKKDIDKIGRIAGHAHTQSKKNHSQALATHRLVAETNKENNKNFSEIRRLTRVLRGDLTDQEVENPIYSLPGLYHKINRIETVVSGWYTDEQLNDRAYSMEEMHRRLESISASVNKLNHTVSALASRDFDVVKDIDFLSKSSIERSDCITYGDMVPASRKEFHLDRYKFAGDFVVGKEVLDAACGTGYGTSLLSKVAHNVDGVDICSDSIDFANKYYSSDNVEFHDENVLTFDNKRTYDAIVSFETIEHVENIDELLLRFSSLLRSDGVLILSVPNNWQDLDLNSAHKHNFTVDKLDSSLKRKFTDVTYFGQNSGSYSRLENRGKSKGIYSIGGDMQGLDKSEVIIAICKQ